MGEVGWQRMRDNRIVLRTETQTGREQSRHPDVSVVDKAL
jgi:hypothetical protein